MWAGASHLIGGAGGVWHVEGESALGCQVPLIPRQFTGFVFFYHEVGALVFLIHLINLIYLPIHELPTT